MRDKTIPMQDLEIKCTGRLMRKGGGGFYGNDCIIKLDHESTVAVPRKCVA